MANTTSLKGPVLNNAALVFNQPVDGTFSDNISGSGSLTKIGAGALTLTGTNSYTGGTQVNGGTLVIGAPDALASGPVTFGGGTLRFAYSGSLDRPITVGPDGFTVDTNGKRQCADDVCSARRQRSVHQGRLRQPEPHGKQPIEPGPPWSKLGALR